MDYYNFDELNAAADISTLRRISGSPKQVRTNGETELHDCCPFTGEGRDRFRINVDRRPMTWFCRYKGSCTKCSGGGDAMEFIAIREGLNRKQDAQKVAAILAAEIGITPRKVSGNVAAILSALKDFSDPCNVSGESEITKQKKEVPRKLTPPPLQWQQTAGNIVTRAAETLHDDTNAEALEALEYLHSRGISDKMIDRYKIGYLPIVPKYFGYYVNLSDGSRYYRKLSDDEKNNAIWVPEGITIPTYLNGELYRVKVRKLNRRAADKAAADDTRHPDKKHDEHEYRYSNISGGIGTALFNGDAATDMHPRHDIIFVEGELDALLINSIMQPVEYDQLQAVTFGSSKEKPPYEQYYKYYRIPERIVIAYDNDQPGQDGAARLQSEIMNIATRETPPRIEKVPEGYKDFGEYYAEGGDIYKLIASWFPL